MLEMVFQFMKLKHIIGKKNEEKLKKNKITKNEFLINNKAPKFASNIQKYKISKYFKYYW